MLPDATNKEPLNTGLLETRPADPAAPKCELIKRGKVSASLWDLGAAPNSCPAPTKKAGEADGTHSFNIRKSVSSG